MRQSMPFMIISMAFAFIAQSIALYRHTRKSLRLLAFIGMETVPACFAIHALITKPGGILGWDFTLALCLWMAGSILLGCILAYVLYLIRKR